MKTLIVALILIYTFAGYLRLIYVLVGMDRDLVFSRGERVRLILLHWILWPLSITIIGRKNNGL